MLYCIYTDILLAHLFYVGIGVLLRVSNICDSYVQVIVDDNDNNGDMLRLLSSHADRHAGGYIGYCFSFFCL